MTDKTPERGEIMVEGLLMDSGIPNLTRRNAKKILMEARELLEKEP